MAGSTKQYSGFVPGKIETYQHSEGLLILRQVNGATRKLHNTSTCLAASGFKLSKPDQMTDSKGRTWQTYKARNAKNDLAVKTIIVDRSGNSWTSVEEWFWAAFFSSPSKTYLAISDIRAL